MRLINKAVRFIIPATVAALPLAFASCDDGDNQIGTSIVSEDVEIVVDSSFVVTGTPVTDNNVISRSTTQMYGIIRAANYGTLTSDVVTQFMPAVTLDTTGVKLENIDSLRLVMTMYSYDFTGDSVAPMGIKVYPLTKNLETPITSTFDPKGYYDANNLLGQTVYNVLKTNTPDSISILGYRQIAVKLPLSMARNLYEAYVEDPSSYSLPSTFAEKVFKGLYIQNSYGSGRITRVSRTAMEMYYHVNEKIEGTDRDTTYFRTGQYYAVTPEVISNNNLRLTIDPAIQARIDAGENIIVTPTGTEIELTFPAMDIINRYNTSVTNVGVVNDLEFFVSAEKIANDYKIAPPPNMLLVLKSKKQEFFTKSKINDNKTSFYAAYNSISQGYTFSGMREYLNDLMERQKKGETITAEDYTFVLTPVSISTETSTTDMYGSTNTVVTAITPFLSFPAMTKINLDKSRVTFTFTKQTLRK